MRVPANDMPNSQIDALFKTVDTNKSGVIDMSEFMAFLKGDEEDGGGDGGEWSDDDDDDGALEIDSKTESAHDGRFEHFEQEMVINLKEYYLHNNNLNPQQPVTQQIYQNLSDHL